MGQYGRPNLALSGLLVFISAVFQNAQLGCLFGCSQKAVRSSKQRLKCSSQS